MLLRKNERILLRALEVLTKLSQSCLEAATLPVRISTKSPLTNSTSKLHQLADLL